MRLVSEKILFTPMERVYSTLNRELSGYVRINTESKFLAVGRSMGLRSHRIYGVRQTNDWIGNLR